MEAGGARAATQRATVATGQGRSCLATEGPCTSKIPATENTSAQKGRWPARGQSPGFPEGVTQEGLALDFQLPEAPGSREQAPFPQQKAPAEGGGVWCSWPLTPDP